MALMSRKFQRDTVEGIRSSHIESVEFSTLIDEIGAKVSRSASNSCVREMALLERGITKQIICGS